MRILVSLLVVTSCLLAQPMAGSYTVIPAAPTAGTNFQTLADAVNALATNGVGGPVTIEIDGSLGAFTTPMPFTTSNGSFTPSNAVLVLGQWNGTSSVNRVTFRSFPGQRVQFDATGLGCGVFWNGADHVTLEGIEIFGATYDAVCLYSEAQHGQPIDPIIDACILRDCGSAGVTIYGNSSRPQNTIVSNCVMWNLQTNNSGPFATLARFGYVSGRRHDNSRIVHNTFYVTTGSGSSFAVLGDTPSGGTGSHYAEISNNIIVRVAQPSAPIFDLPLNGGASGLPALMDSNCYWDPSGTNFAIGTFAASDFNAWQAGSGVDLNSFSADPLFVDAANFDLHLDPTSPCVDASTVVTPLMTDFEGDPRQGLFDIGADEAAATLPCGVPRWQDNSSVASLLLNGALALPCARAETSVMAGQSFNGSFSSTSVNLPWELIMAFRPLVPRGGGGLLTAGGQIINVDLITGPSLYLFGGTTFSFSSPFPGNFTANFAIPTPATTFTAQMVTADPGSLEGFRLSQGSQVNVQ